MAAKDWIPACAGMTLLVSSAEAGAEPAFARLYKQQFGYSPSCNACHKDGGGTPLNDYGQHFKDAGLSLAAFAAIGDKDSDGDGSANEAEVRARSNPGAGKSTPAAKGDWLDTASLIPREVQALFPEVRTYLPKDALLTEADIARAKTLGAVLSKNDENTIYVAVQDQRPVGAAIIFPARFQDKDFFLLLATDRQLKVTAVAPLHASKVPQAARKELYERFKGVPVDKLSAAAGADLDAAIAGAVKKAGTLLYVRLKGA